MKSQPSASLRSISGRSGVAAAGAALAAIAVAVIAHAANRATIEGGMAALLSLSSLRRWYLTSVGPFRGPRRQGNAPPSPPRSRNATARPRY
jgi:hypothetical protein